MAKKKSARASKKKDGKGATGKKASSAAAATEDHHHGYEVSAYLRYLRDKPKLTSREDKLLHMYAYAEASNMSEVALFKDEKSLEEVRGNEESWNEADLLYEKDPRMWIFTIYDLVFENEDLFLPELQNWLEQTQSRAESMVKSAITSERIGGVLIEGYVLKLTIDFMMNIQRGREFTVDASTKIRSYCQPMTRLANVTKDTKKTSTLAGYALCKVMVLSFFHLKTLSSQEIAFETVLQSGILEQVLRNITIPWISFAEEEEISDLFFRRLCCPIVSMHKTFKPGSPCHNALLDILQGRVRPCKENEFVMNALYSLKKCVDISYFKPIDAHIQNQVIEMNRRTCAKCRTTHHSKQLLVCAKCKYISYCSKECQVEDWSDHKEVCHLFQHEQYKKDKKFIRNFFTKYQDLITQKVKAVSQEFGLETMECIIDLHFSGYGIAPALRDVPEIRILSAKNLLNESEEKALQFSVNELYTGNDVKRFIDSMISTLGKNCAIVHFVFMHRSSFGVVHLQADTYGDMWFMN